MNNTYRILRRQQVQRATGLSRSTLYAKIAAGQFPRPVKLGDRAVGWLADEVDAWLQAKIDARDLAQ